MEHSEETKRKAVEILGYIVKQCNDDIGKSRKEQLISFGADWGGNSLTVFQNGRHSHVGSVSDDATFEQLIDQLHDLLLKGHGLSWE